tara:strand:+ start:339 stop:1088 length:750 start_codon:yes stop_codon:yes gene_type:complete
MKNNIFETEYKRLLMSCLLEGEQTPNRTGVDTIKLFNQTLNIDLRRGFPILTSKKIFFNKAVAEFEWMFGGHTDLKYLQERGINWWNDFAVNGNLGRVYGYQIRKFGGSFDQIEFCINEINNNTRRAVISLWNPNDLEMQALPCCYTSFNFVRTNNKLSMTMDFRSSDMFLGLPYDIIVGAMLLIEIAKRCNLEPAILGLNLKDAHIYVEHKKNVLEYYRNPMYSLPTYKNKKLISYNSEKLIKTKLIK